MSEDMSPDFSGVWRADLEKSRLGDALLKAIVVKIDHTGPELVVEVVMTKADDTRDHTAFRCQATGTETTQSMRGAQMRSRTRWVGDELLIESWVTLGGRESHFRDYWSLSPDARTLIMEHRDDDLAGQITLLERV
jgi:hypothetical protein